MAMKTVPQAYLGAKEPEIAGMALMDLLHDPSEIVRSEAVDALGILGYASAVRAVMALLSNDPQPLCHAEASATLSFGRS